MTHVCGAVGGVCGVAVWSAVRQERLLEGFPGQLVVFDSNKL